MSEDPNPYEAPHEVGESSPVMDAEPVRPDYPGGLKTALGIGVVGGIITGLMFIGVIPAPGHQDNSILTSLATWVFAFAFIGWLLPGSPQRRIVRGFIGFVASFPALILYVPVCGMVSGAVSGTTGMSIENGSLFVGSVVAFATVFVLFATIIRQLSRSSYGPTGDIDSGSPIDSDSANTTSSDE